MKLLIVGDVHWSEYSSIIRKRGSKYSKRLENLINSLNWTEEQAELHGCDTVVYLGDFFDRTELNAAELTALQEVVWAPVKHQFLVGNHEGLNSDLSVSSAHLFSMIPNAEVIDQPRIEYTFGYKFVYLPYICEDDRKPLRDYLQDDAAWMTQELKQTIIFSHNDLKMQYGIFTSVDGFDPQEIQKYSKLCFNGHLHNKGTFCSGGYNVGNLTGQNFSEDATQYNHEVVVLDLSTVEPQLEFIENPYAFNFYKLEAKTESQVNRCISELKNNSIITIKVPESLLLYTRKYLSEQECIKEYRVVCVPEVKQQDNNSISTEVELQVVNHLEEFVKFVQANMEVTALVQSELNEVCK